MVCESVRWIVPTLVAGALVAAASPGPGEMIAIGDAGYHMDAYEVTNAQMAAFLNAEGNRRIEGVAWVEMTGAHVLIEEHEGAFRPKEGFASHPAVEVSFDGAKAYCNWAGKHLPTEAEWLSACEGAERLTHPWGHHFRTAGPEARPWANVFGVGDGFQRTSPVGSFPYGRSPFGLYDMGGNVWEWTVSTDGKPFLHGGSWVNGKSLTKCAKRTDMTSSHSYIKGNSVGLRCAR